MDTKKFTEKIEPFFWVEHDKSFSVCLNAGIFKTEIFKIREDEGFEGNGYDWTSLAVVFLNEIMPNLKGKINFDPEAGMFSAYSSNKYDLQEFALSFKNACDNDIVIRNLFSHVELD
ncbi:immunity 51 family protein [Flavobacterium sp. 22076]|uniref:immunity 51 family protein n=1 Tax=unclassified Flavobacterium TaxID=196869 RepID=UPI003F84A37A